MQRTLTISSISSTRQGIILQTSDLHDSSPLQFISKDLFEYYQYVETRYLALINLHNPNDEVSDEIEDQ